MSKTNYQHQMAAHCESGMVAGLLRHHGLNISEPLIFGIAGAYFFGYFDTSRFAIPMLAFRGQPGDIRKQVSRRLGVKFDSHYYPNVAAGQMALDTLIDQGIPGGIQVDMFAMEYIPMHMRAHNNAHFVVITDRDAESYTVSDCYYPDLAKVTIGSLNKARHSRGSFAPRGLLIHPVSVPQSPDLKKAIYAGIKQTCFNMLKIPLPFMGVNGIRYFGKNILTWPQKIKDEQFLSHCLMRVNIGLEEQGTGGAGFRFLFATFLQDAWKVTGNDTLGEVSKQMMENGDRWREISLAAARIGKRRDFSAPKMQELSDMIIARSEAERDLMVKLEKCIK
jgi:hypothetical protein